MKYLKQIKRLSTKEVSFVNQVISNPALQQEISNPHHISHWALDYVKNKQLNFEFNVYTKQMIHVSTALSPSFVKPIKELSI